MSGQKPLVNGLENGPTVGGFRHHLPQMPVMSRNVKIAQSKSKVNEEINSLEHSTVEVEGVGKVVHIGSKEIMEEESPAEKLLQELESSPSSTKENDLPETLNGKGLEQATEKPDINKTGNKMGQETEKELKDQPKPTDNLKSTSDDDNKDNKEKTEHKEQSKEISSGSKRGRKRLSEKKTDDVMTSPKLLKTEQNDDGNKTSIAAPTDNKEGVVSPGSKRQRKPKKLDLEDSIVEKSPKKAKGKQAAAEKTDAPKLEVTPEYEAMHPVKWLVGDLVWAKVAGHPWWPCMISYDPFTAVYTKLTVNSRKGREYHVQFFGDAAERGWIGTNNLLEFQGKEKFDEFVDNLYKTAKSKNDEKRLKKWYGVPPARAAALKIGINAAEEALPFSRNERKTKYTFVYQLPKGKGKTTISIPDEKKADELAEDVKLIKEAQKEKQNSEGSKGARRGRKRKLDLDSSPAPNPDTKRQKVETPKSETPVKSVKRNSLQRKVSGTEGSFEVFCQKEKNIVLSEHPEFDDDAFLDFCRQQWCRMSKQQKVRYKSKHSEDVKSPEPRLGFSSPESPTRQRKPSKKLMEAEEDNKVVDEALSDKPVDKKAAKSTPRKSLSSPQPNKGSKKTPEENEKKSSDKKPGRRSRVSEVVEPKQEPSKEEIVEKKSEVPEENIKKAGKRGRSSSRASDIAAPKENHEVAHKSAPKVNDGASKTAPKINHVISETAPKTNDVSDSKTDKEVKDNKDSVLNNSSVSQTLEKNEKKQVDKKPRKSLKDNEVVDQKVDTSEGEKVQIEPTNSTLPVKKVKSRRSMADSDTQSDDSGRSTPSIPDRPPIPQKKEKEEFEYEPEIYKLSSVGPQKKENICQICEQTGRLLECKGSCHGFFHMDCLGITKEPAADSFKCDECQSGNHSCFVCKKCDSTTQRCSVPQCGKFYHLECVKDLPQTKLEGKGFVCPLHVCHTCVALNNKTATRNSGRLLRCVRCPTAYHVGDFCIAAGSINMTGLNIVCARHFQPTSQRHHSHVNVSWCFNCSKGGTLLCCESCPAAFHADCLKIEFPTGRWCCSECAKGKKPLYGELIWVKIGTYRWWPGEICHPRNVPLNIQEKPHQVGEFPVHFLGSHDYFWLHQGRVFSFQDGDKGNASGLSSSQGLKKHFSRGLIEAAEGYRIWKEFKDNKEQIEEEKLKKKPAKFKMVKTNVPLGSVTIIKADLSDLPRCECKPDQDDPCGMSSDCLNHMMMYECHPALCPAGDKCQNQFFTKRLYPPQQSYKTEGRGWGLQALADIKKGQFVNEYVGDLIDEEECKRRLEKAHEDDITDFYMMTLDSDRIIDAGPKGNLSRFMNHSCQPNLETQKWNVNGDVRVGLFAMVDIKSGDELTFNYNFDCLGNEKLKCRCGAANCSGFLGVRPKTQAEAAAEARKEAKMTKLKKKKKNNVKRKHDDDCFRCGEGGELLMCDRPSCPKSYHLQCLGLNKPPYGKWDCPWHHCDECGKPASQKCVECPNSFCTAHSETNIKVFDKKIYCTEHDDLLQTLAESHSEHTTNDELSDSEVESKSKGSKLDKGGSKSEKGGVKTKSEKNSTTKNNNKEEKKKGSKQSLDKNTKPIEKGISEKTLDKNTKVIENGISEKGEGKPGKGIKGRKGSGKVNNVTKGLTIDDPLAVAPMFDSEDEEEEFGLVIDIPTF